ncbi:hypothetical protein WJX73_005115 [Symbiochloris irregularis]|uniref:DUF202 domain-containing protein n=1 Tax=Symbiochloris irregularis TaxID=706552 RepID=A0AAW1PWH2_9CHLO
MPPNTEAGPSTSQRNPAPGEVTDALFGTRSYTAGAQYQLPRKIPLRIEPKTYFANERTFLAWLHMAVTLGGVATALVGFSTDGTGAGEGEGSRPIRRTTTDLITVLALPLSIIIIVYAAFTFYWRSVYMQKKQVGFFKDWLAPAIIAGLVMAFLIVLFLVSAVQIWLHHTS